MGRIDEELARDSDGTFRGYKNKARKGGKVIAEYIYCDKDREPYHRKDRTEFKDFIQYYWVKKGLSGSWRLGEPKGPLIPYLLPELLKADAEEIVFVPEGEKDTETVWADFDLVATCGPGGAGRWPVELNEWFVGKKRVVIVADNDAPGRAHAALVANNLSSIVDDVRVLHMDTLPDGSPMPEHGDVTDWFEAGGTKEQFLAMAEAAPQFVALRQIQIVTGKPAQVQDETEDALLAANQPVLVRAGQLVQPVSSEYPAAKGHKTTSTVLRTITASNLAYMTNKHAARYVRYDGRSKQLVPADPPAKIMQGLVERGQWRFPRVAGVVNAPTLRPDGTILDEPGYDKVTQLWCAPDPGFRLGDIPPKPTKSEAKAALGLLTELLSGFPFVTPLDRSVALAATLTAIVRGAFEVAPMFLFAAHSAGTGKSYLANVIAAIVHGRPCPVITASGNSEEMEKRVGALLLEGPTIVSLDNLTHDLDGEQLCQMVEQPVVKVRVLGKSEMPQCEWRGTLFATGNNVTFTGDMVRRGLACNMDAGVERPEARPFAFDAMARALAARGSFVAAGLLIARAYAVAEAKVDCPPLGSYGGWERFVRHPLIWLGQPDPVESIEHTRANDPKRRAVATLFDQWRQHLKLNEGYTVSQIIECARESALQPTSSFGIGVADYQPVRPEFNALLMERCTAPRGGIDARQLGKWLSQIRGQVHGGLRLEIAKQSASHGNRWALVEGRTAKAG
jgi:hypothetical protein